MRRNTVFLKGTAALAIVMGLTACGTSAPTNTSQGQSVEVEGTTTDDTKSRQEKPHGVAINLADNSILKFDGNEASAQLVDDMRAGNTPKSCTVRYDQMGGLPTVTVNDARTIREVYKKLARVHVDGESNMSITDSYHLVSFELQDGTTAAYNFEGEGILVRGKQNYAVSNTGNLWSYVRELQAQYEREQSAGDDWLAIKLDDEEELVIKCPTSAPPGERIRVVLPEMLGAHIHVAVNGSEDFGSFSSSLEYEFVMPNTPVTVRVWSSPDGDPGS